MKKKIIIAFVLLFGLVLILKVLGLAKEEKQLEMVSDEFGGEKRVEIIDYDGDAMEPYISRDDRYLFFNDNEGPRNKELYWAQRVDDLKYQFKGEVIGVNSEFVDGNPTMDEGGNFYFITTRDLEKGDFGSVYVGKFDNGRVDNLKKVGGTINENKKMWLNMGIEVTAKGDEMYTSYARFRLGSKHPSEGNIRYATRSEKGFDFAADEKRILQNINTEKKIEYAGEVSGDGLEMFYSQVNLSRPPKFKLYHAKRFSKEDSFGVPKLVKEPFEGNELAFVEAPCLSSDGKRLYYHKLHDGRFYIFMLTRK